MNTIWNKWTIGIGVMVFIFGVLAIYFGGFGTGSFFASDNREDLLEDRIQEKDERIAKLERENEKHIIQIRDLTAEVQRLNASQPDGGAVEEKRKALVEMEAGLKHKENQLSQREEKIEISEERINRQQQEFYENKNLTLEEIGEAKQIRREYKYMRKARERAEERANMWLIAIAGFLFLMFVTMVWRSKKTNDEIYTVRASTEENQRLIASVDQRLLDQFGNKTNEE